MKKYKHFLLFLFLLGHYKWICKLGNKHQICRSNKLFNNRFIPSRSSRAFLTKAVITHAGLHLAEASSGKGKDQIVISKRGRSRQ